MADPVIVAERNHAAQQSIMEAIVSLVGPGAREDIASVALEGGGPEYQAMRHNEKMAEVLKGLAESRIVREEADISRLDSLDEGHVRALRAAGYETKTELEIARDAELLDVDGIGEATVAALREELPYREPHVSELGLLQNTDAVLEEAGYSTRADLQAATDAELLALSGIGEKSVARIREVAPADSQPEPEEESADEGADDITLVGTDEQGEEAGDDGGDDGATA